MKRNRFHFGRKHGGSRPILDRTKLCQYFLDHREESPRFTGVVVSNVCLGFVNKVFPRDAKDPHGILRSKGKIIPFSFGCFHRMPRKVDPKSDSFRVPEEGDFIWAVVRELPQRNPNFPPRYVASIWGYVDELSLEFLVANGPMAAGLRVVDRLLRRVRKAGWNYFIGKNASRPGPKNSQS